MTRSCGRNSLYDVFMQARPRPVSPFYMMMTQVMQPEFSAAVSGIKTSDAALASASEQMAHILGAGR
jgi:multiple sugar transport system substrate-binding protein